MAKPVRRRLKYSTRIIQLTIWLVALGLAAWIISQLPLSNLAATITQLNYSDWVIWFTLNVLVILLFTARWRLITRATGLPTKFLSLLRVRHAGQFINFVTPGPQLGAEPLQVYWLWRRYGVSAHAALLAVGLDRFYEFWVNFAVLLLAVLALLSSSTMTFVDWQTIAVILIGLMLSMSVLAWILLRQPYRIRNFAQRLTSPWQQHKRLNQVQTQWSQLQELLQIVMSQQLPALLTALLVSLCAWIGMILEFWLLLEFVDVPLDLATFVFLFTVVRLAFLLPLPGGIGTVEAALLWAFQTLALPLTAAAGLIVLMRFRDVVILLTGAMVLPGLHRENSNPAGAVTR